MLGFTGKTWIELLDCHWSERGITGFTINFGLGVELVGF